LRTAGESCACESGRGGAQTLAPLVDMEGFLKSSAAGRWRETGSSSGTGLAQRVMLGRRGDACSDDRSPVPSRSVVLPISTRSIQGFRRAGYSVCGVLLLSSFAVLASGYGEHGPITSDPTISGRPGPKVTDGARANLSAKIRVESTLVLIPRDRGRSAVSFRRWP
jgi:hypothetical protein